MKAANDPEAVRVEQLRILFKAWAERQPKTVLRFHAWMLKHAPAILAVAVSVILHLTFGKKRVNDVPFRKTAHGTESRTMISPLTKGEKTVGREYLEEFWEEDR